MHAAWTCAALLASLPGLSRGQEQPAAMLHIAAGNTQSLKKELLALTQQLLPAGVVVDPQRAWLSLSSPLPAVSKLEVRPAWSGTDVVSLPLMFELYPGSARGSREPIRAVLGARLLQEVPVATRRLRKGSMVSCNDLGTELRDIRHVPATPLAIPCAIGPQAVTLHDIGKGQVMRSGDLGPAPDVMAGAPVRVSVSNGAISVTTTAIALADAKVGDLIDVRLQHPVRTLKARVSGPGSAQLADEQS
jgi:flagella basal body P-ring formation protein FlgA